MGKPGMSLAYSCCALGAALAASGCSLVYDTGDLRGGRDGGMSADADPDALFVARVTPESVFEGEGSSFVPDDEAMVRAIPIVLEGQNMTADTMFTIDGLGLNGTIEDVAVSGDGHFAAFALRVPIVDSLGDGDTNESLAIRLTKGEEEAPAPLITVTGLDALERTDEGVNTDDLHAMYTHVVLSGNVPANGDAPLRIVATAGIQINGSLRADAGTAPNAGPGGCRGGGAASNADCGGGSGKAGETSASPGGGGGGGYGTMGTAGTGGDGQAGGMVGQRFVVPMPPAEGATAHGAGGGGGGDLVSGGGTGGSGGGSGGIIELTTLATFTLSASAVLSAAGGDGDDFLCSTGGGGGGGSGGAILLRAGTLLVTAGASVVAPAGNGMGSSGCKGGNGGKGRIRIDRGNDSAIDTDPAPFIGATPAVQGLPVIVTEALLALPVRGDASESYQVYVGDGGPMAFNTDADGVASPEVTLEPGLNRLCVQAASGADLDYPESKNCVDVAYIKP